MTTAEDRATVHATAFVVSRARGRKLGIMIRLMGGCALLQLQLPGLGSSDLQAGCEEGTKELYCTKLKQREMDEFDNGE